jgi:predicted RNA-binding protein YlxR (DUF448 family)
MPYRNVSPTSKLAAKPHQRTCVGCGLRAERLALVRFVGAPTPTDKTRAVGLADDMGWVTPPDVIPTLGEAHRRAPAASGRGSYVHPAPKCIARASVAGFSRSFRRAIKTSTSQTASSVCEHLDKQYTRLAAGFERRGTLASEELQKKLQQMYWMREGLLPLAASGNDVCSRSLEVR